MPVAGYAGVSDAEYRRRIRAWTMYDWANSAFSTTILAAVLPIYYSQVAGETLPSAAVATQYWTISLSIALFLVALISPILGTISDLRRGKKPMLAISAGVGIVATGLLALAGSGDWLLASIFFVVGRMGFGASLIFSRRPAPPRRPRRGPGPGEQPGLRHGLRGRRDPAGGERRDDPDPGGDPRARAGRS